LQTHEWWLQNHPQEILPSVPQNQNLTTFNPFAEDSVNRHPRIKRTAIVIPQGGAVNGYVKARFWNSDGRAATVVVPKYSAFYQSPMAVHHRSIPYVPDGKAYIPRLPRDFGRGLELDELDSKLFKFCEHFANV
jgi:hypothetical protein